MDRSTRLLRSGLLMAALVSVCAYPVLFLYFRNIKEVVPTQVFAPMLVFTAIAMVAWLAFGMLSGTTAKGAFAALLFILVFMNYSLIEEVIRSIVPEWRWWRIAPTFLFLFMSLALALRVFVNRREGDDSLLRITVGLGAAYLVLTFFNAADGMSVLARARPAEGRTGTDYSPEGPGYPAILSTPERPNFYYFIFDEYARQDVLKKYTGLDNSPFLQLLESKGFKVSYSSYSNSVSTPVAVGNLLNFGRISASTLKTGRSLPRPPLIEVFKKAGYKTVAGSQFYRFDADLVDVPLAAKEFPISNTIGRAAMARSLLVYGIYLRRNENEARRENSLSLLQRTRDIIKEPTHKPKFLFLHILLPHEPFVFDENGDPVAEGDMHNWADPRHYAGQVIFLSKPIDELTTAIITQDPQAVVLLQSDHGARSFAHIKFEEKRACLNCVYLGGNDVQIEGLSPVNTLRLALNYALGLQLDIRKE